MIPSVRKSVAALILVALATTATPDAQRPSAAQLSRAAWDALNAGRIQEAAAAFAEALTQAPQQPVLLLGAGVAAHLQGREDEARRLLVDSLKIEPALTEASLVLGAVLYQAGDLDGAIDVYQQALTSAPDQPRLVQQLEAWRKEAALHRGFGRKLGDHFTVLFEGPAEAQLADRAVSLLEASYLRIATALYTYPSGVITVVLYTREQFRDITQSPEWAGGSFDGRIRVPVQGALENPAEFQRVLSHELTHALVRSIAGRSVPLWLDEGLAVTFDGSDSPRGDALIGRAVTLLPLSRLERSFASLSAAEAAIAYAESAVAVREIFARSGAPAMVGLLEAIGRGVPFAPAFEQNILISYAEFDAKLRR
jgi:tetratricopeptide (TPR) repeat protein